jgi:hypothetical protein
VIVGWGKSGKVLGHGPVRTCERCHNQSTWIVVETSKKVSMYFVRVAKWKTEYWVACPVCKNTTALDSREHAQAVVAATAGGQGTPV